MKEYKTVEVPATTKSVFDYIKCELCERTSHRADWEPSEYEVDEPEVALSVGTHYPGDYNVTRKVLDICPDCFRNKLIPWFEAQGGTVRTVE